MPPVQMIGRSPGPFWLWVLGAPLVVLNGSLAAVVAVYADSGWWYLPLWLWCFVSAAAVGVGTAELDMNRDGAP